jgi:hypothetical protein
MGDVPAEGQGIVQDKIQVHRFCHQEVQRLLLNSWMGGLEVCGQVLGDGVVFPGELLRCTVTVTNTSKDDSVNEIAWATVQVGFATVHFYFEGGSPHPPPPFFAVKNNARARWPFNERSARCRW